MNDKLDKLKDIKIENFIWIIYIGIIILSWYANSKEKNFILFNDEKSRQEYQNLIILIFYYFDNPLYEEIKFINHLEMHEVQLGGSQVEFCIVNYTTITK